MTIPLSGIGGDSGLLRYVGYFIPSYEPLVSVHGRPVAVGYFEFDLCRLSNLLVTPQTWFIYAFSGEVMTAPVPAAFAKLPEETFDSVRSW
jgi:hypothetical protein